MGANETGCIGQSLRRREDVRFLTGAGQYTDDATMAHQSHAYFLRSPHAHAMIRGIDTAKAKKAPGNKCYLWALGDRVATDAAFAKAAHVTKLGLVNNRLASNAIEPRAAVASYQRADESYTLYVTSQNPHVERVVHQAAVGAGIAHDEPRRRNFVRTFPYQAPAVLMDAVLDALEPVGVEHVDMPASPHRVWQAIQSARAHA